MSYKALCMFGRTWSWGWSWVVLAFHEMVQSLIERYLVFHCIWCLFRVSQLPPAPPDRQLHWFLSPEEKKCRGMISLLLLVIPRTIIIARNSVCMTLGTLVRSLHKHLLFLQFMFWSWSVFLIKQKLKHSSFLVF